MSAQASDLLHCSFCDKAASELKKLIAGPGVYICNECVDLCVAIIEDESDDGLATLTKLSSEVDRLVDRLRQDGVPWDQISEALRKETEED